MQNLKNNLNLFIIALIAVVNALGYGIIIPVLYSYSLKYGLNDFQNGLLFAVFSICQFISTPIIGRLSDKYGRRPLLIISLLGTVLSFFMMAFAPSALFLFLARALDGITSGNIPVASAVISDSTAPKDRAKGFGIIGASFGFGFIFGPAISALTSGTSISLPFIIAGTVTLIAVLLTFIFLPETNKNKGHVRKGNLFNIKALLQSITDEKVGLVLLISLIYATAFSVFIYAWQPVSIKVIHLTVQQNSIVFTLFGIVGLAAQLLIIPKVVKVVGDKRSIVFSLLMLTLTFAAFYSVKTFAVMLIVAVFMGIANSFVGPLLQSILSKLTDEESQGTIMGLYQSYFSIGQIIGPIIGGAVATFSIPMPFLVGSGLCLLCTIVAYQLKDHTAHKQHTFQILEK